MGGMQKHSKMLAEYLASAGQQVVLYHVLPNGIELDEAQIRAVFSSKANACLTIRTFHYPIEDKWPGHYLRAQKMLSEFYFEQFKKETFVPKLIFSKGFMAWSFLKNKADLNPATKIAVKFHGMNMFQSQPDFKGELTKYMLRAPVLRIMHGSDFVFSYGGKITEVIAKALKVESGNKKIIELPSGIDDSWLNAPLKTQAKNQTGCKRFLFVGRYDRLKGLPELFTMLKKRPDLNLKLTVVGPIPDHAKLSDRRVTFLGSISDPLQLRNIYDKHDVLLCPSISEGMPNVIMEAMARELAVIATDVGATNILVQPDKGWLIPPQNGEALEAAVEAAIADEKMAMKGKLGAEHMRTYHDWSNIAARFLEWYNSLQNYEL